MPEIIRVTDIYSALDAIERIVAEIWNENIVTSDIGRCGWSIIIGINCNIILAMQQ